MKGGGRFLHNWSGRHSGIYLWVTGESTSARRTTVGNGQEANVFERLWKLWTMICKMIMEGSRDAGKVAEILQSIVNGTAGVKVYLRRIFESEEILTPAVLGNETLEDLVKIFNGGVEGSASAVLSPTTTPATKTTVYVMAEDGTSAELFESLGQERRRFASLFQVAAFCRVNSDKLRKEGRGTFFEIEGGFVADVYAVGTGHQLKVRVSQFSDDFVWFAGNYHHLVSLQQ